MTWAQERLLAVDTETTGPLPSEALICSFALVEFDHGQVTRSRHGLCNPGVPIPPEATAVHGITDADVEARGGTLEATVKGIKQTLDAAVAARAPIVIYNAAYDLQVLSEAHRRLNGAPMFTEDWAGCVIDPLVIDRHVERFRKGSRKLTAVAEHYGVKLSEAHTASADAVAAAEVAFAISRIYPEVEKADPELLTHLQEKWHQDWFDQFSDYLRKQGKDPLPETERAWPVRGLVAL